MFLFEGEECTTEQMANEGKPYDGRRTLTETFQTFFFLNRYYMMNKVFLIAQNKTYFL